LENDMAEPSTREVLNHLIETCTDAEHGFRVAADLATDARLQSLFTTLAGERGRWAAELVPHAQRLGGAATADGTTAGSLHRRWMELKDRLTGHDDAALLADVRRGDGVTLRVYEHALQAMLPVSIRDVVERQYEALRSTHQQIESMSPAPKTS
jgi:uncharacterized protein (TIGR02284 family)